MLNPEDPCNTSVETFVVFCMIMMNITVAGEKTF